MFFQLLTIKKCLDGYFFQTLNNKKVIWDIVFVQILSVVLGTNFALRQIAKRISATEEIKDGEQWSLKITSTFKNVHLIFTLGQEFDETTMDGRKVKVK